MPKEFSVTVHRGPSDEKIVYACDKELLGKMIRDGNLILDVNEEMYGEMLVDEDELIELLEMASSFTLVGERTVSVAVKKQFIHPESVLKIGGIPYAMFINIY